VLVVCGSTQEISKQHKKVFMTLHSLEGRLAAAAPFDFGQSLKFLGLFRPAMGEQQIGEQALTKATSFNGQTVVFHLRSVGTVDAPALNYSLYSDMPMDEPLREAAEARIRFFLSLDDDLRPFYALGQADPAFAPIIEALYGYHQVKFLTPFENACWAILSQRNLIAVSRRMKQGLTESFGSALDVDGERYEAFPEPFALAMRNTDEVNAVVRNLWKAEGLVSVARAFDNVDEVWLRGAPDDEVERWLLGIKGIGAWSASFILLRGLGRMRILPAGDKWLTEAASVVYGQMVTQEDVTRLAAPYGEYAGYWAHYLRAAM
jgi:DNA-3-methyladenine glycosylase II